MKRQDLLELAGRNLREAMLRNSLTTLGVAVGVASLVAMLSLGVGLQELASARLMRSGLFDSVMVFSRRNVRGFDSIARRTATTDADRPLDEYARQEIARLPGVREVYPELRFGVEIRHAGKSYFTAVGGLTPSAKENDAFDELKGQFFTGPEAEEAILLRDFAKQLDEENPDAVIGQEFALRYAERQPLPAEKSAAPAAPKVSSASSSAAADSGDGAESMELGGFTVLRREKKLRIVGVLEKEPFGGMRIANSNVLIPIALALKLNTVQASTLRDALRGQQNYVNLTVKLKSPGQVQATRDAIGKMGFTTWSILDATRNMTRFFAVLDLFLGIFGSLALAVASLGIVNTLVMAVLERRREIGIMKAIGASDHDVKRLFFFEAGAMGLTGGVLGVLLGWSIGLAINFGTSYYLQRQQLPPENVSVSPWWLVIGAVGFAVLVSLIAGLYPAARAAKLDPVQALRYE